MDRRDLLKGGALISVGLFASRVGRASSAAARLRVPGKEIRVAFMIGENTNVIDLAGAWEVFGDTMPPTADGQMSMPFTTYTVAPTKEVQAANGGLNIVPNYSIADAPQPHVIVVPAHRSTPESVAWLRSASARTDVTMSVCTGAFQLGKAGLLEGLKATTHHEFWDDFAKQYPKVNLERGVRFVDNGHIATAGGLTSGIDLALHVVARYYGEEVAAATAKYMEYASERWKTGAA
jgi:transcriptional regulator GlxA family with amidase domain